MIADELSDPSERLAPPIAGAPGFSHRSAERESLLLFLPSSRSSSSSWWLSLCPRLGIAIPVPSRTQWPCHELGVHPPWRTSLNRNVSTERAKDFLHGGRNHLERLPRTVSPLDADLTCLLEQPAVRPALDQHEIILLQLENSRIPNVKIHAELVLQYLLVEVTCHTSENYLKESGEIQCRSARSVQPRPACHGCNPQ